MQVATGGAASGPCGGRSVSGVPSSASRASTLSAAGAADGAGAAFAACEVSPLSLDGSAGASLGSTSITTVPVPAGIRQLVKGQGSGPPANPTDVQH
ncbi:hypothetical protein [Marinobacter sp.]|uniref:hypothetical protein n=1 Tax=Marinobacter sp. TaxID=50741 RepID=UPI003A94E0D3